MLMNICFTDGSMPTRVSQTAVNASAQEIASQGKSAAIGLESSSALHIFVASFTAILAFLC
jgi:hypothetical protein